MPATAHHWRRIDYKNGGPSPLIAQLLMPDDCFLLNGDRFPPIDLDLDFISISKYKANAREWRGKASDCWCAFSRGVHAENALSFSIEWSQPLI